MSWTRPPRAPASEEAEATATTGCAAEFPAAQPKAVVQPNVPIGI